MMLHGSDLRGSLCTAAGFTQGSRTYGGRNMKEKREGHMDPDQFYIYLGSSWSDVKITGHSLWPTGILWVVLWKAMQEVIPAH